MEDGVMNYEACTGCSQYPRITRDALFLEFNAENGDYVGYDSADIPPESILLKC